MTYVLYNDGWLLEECNQNSSSVTPLSLPTQTQDEAMASVLAYWDQSEHNDIFGHPIDTPRRITRKSSLQKESELSYAYYFLVAWKNRLGYDAEPVNFAVRYQFDLTSGWTSEITTANITWN